MKALLFPDILLNSLENGHMIIDDHFQISYWNRWLAINTQISNEEISGKSLQEFYPELNYHVLHRKIKTALRLKTPSFYDPNSSTKFISINRNKVTTSALSLMQQQVTISPYIIDENKVMISIYDISELHETKILLQQEIRKVNELNKVLEADQEMMDESIMMVRSSKSGDILNASSFFCNFLEYKKEDLIGKNIAFLTGEDIEKSIYMKLQLIIVNKEFWSGEQEIQTSRGETKWLETRITPIHDQNDNLIEFHTIYYDITSTKLLEELYITDTLTQLYNRAYFDDLMHSITKHQRKADVDFVLVISDIDHFKGVNDTYGHQVGDVVLKDVATTLKQALRENDVIARWGGEEFVMMLKCVTIDEAKMIIEKLRFAIESRKIELGIHVTCSFGITPYKAGENIDDTFKRADEALYEAKKWGRNRMVERL